MKALFAILAGLLLTASPALACVGELCEPDMYNVGTVETAFSNSGFFAVYESGLWMNGMGEGTITDVSAWGPSDLSVVRNADFGYDFELGKTVNEDTAIMWSPDSMMSQFSFGKDSWYGWNGIGGAEYFREAMDPMVIDTLHTVGIGQGGTMDRINVNIGAMPLSIYTSLGLNQGATCEDPVVPPELDPPVCTFCPPDNDCGQCD